MQIELLPYKAIEAIAVQMQYAAEGSPAQIYHIPPCRGMTRDEITLLAQYWHYLNAESYELDHRGAAAIRYDLLKIRYGQHPMPVYRFIKYLLYLECHIDRLRIIRTRELNGEEDEALAFLSIVIRSVLETLVMRMPEYEKAPFPGEIG